MKIVSQFPFLWPQFNWGLAAGENNVDESDIPLAVHAKLEFLSRPGPKAATRDADDKVVMVDGPSAITGYAPSAEFVAAAEKHNPKKAAARMPRVATLRTAKAASPEAPAQTDVNKHDGNHDKRK
jgi:hypothetical protein